jgi:hypothetical protein
VGRGVDDPLLPDELHSGSLALQVEYAHQPQGSGAGGELKAVSR